MSFTDPSTIGLALMFLVPGFISIKIWDLLVPTERRELSTSSLEVFVYSALNFAFLGGPLLAVGVAPANAFLGYLLWVVVLLVAPILWPVILRSVLRSNWLKRFGVVDPTPKPWDYVFGKGEGYWVILHMKDGRRIGGRYDVKSFASSFPNEEQLYLEEVWDLDQDGRFKGKHGRTRGIMVSCSDLYAIELFSGDGEEVEVTK